MRRLRVHRLSGVPPGGPWDNLGSQWRVLATLWLHAETLLSKAACKDLSTKEIIKSDIPEDWKRWMIAKLMKNDAHKPSDNFGKMFMIYLKELPTDICKPGGTVHQENDSG